MISTDEVKIKNITYRRVPDFEGCINCAAKNDPMLCHELNIKLSCVIGKQEYVFIINKQRKS